MVKRTSCAITTLKHNVCRHNYSSVHGSKPNLQNHFVLADDADSDKQVMPHHFCCRNTLSLKSCGRYCICKEGQMIQTEGQEPCRMTRKSAADHLKDFNL